MIVLMVVIECMLSIAANYYISISISDCCFFFSSTKDTVGMGRMVTPGLLERRQGATRKTARRTVRGARWA